MTIFRNVKSEKSGPVDSVRRVFLTIYNFQIKIECMN